jgi:transcriptional regulator with XRE-family HTH domain
VSPDEAPDPTPTIIRNVRALRRQRRWSAERLAEEVQKTGCYMTRGIVTNMESGRRASLMVAELYAFAHVLGVSAGFLCEEQICPTCSGGPPEGFTCNRCGLGGRVEAS